MCCSGWVVQACGGLFVWGALCVWGGFEPADLGSASGIPSISREIVWAFLSWQIWISPWYTIYIAGNSVAMDSI